MCRIELLQEIVSAGPNMVKATQQIYALSFDSESELVTLTRAKLESVLHRFLCGDLSSLHLEDWANFIECRDDIDYSEVAADIHRLANIALETIGYVELATEIINRGRST